MKLDEVDGLAGLGHGGGMMASVRHAVVLAGGRSSRMGVDKALVTVGGVMMLERVARAAVGAGLKVVVVGRGEAPAGWPRDLAGEFLADEGPGFLGPVAGLVRGMEFVGGDVMLLACDMPLVSAGMIEELVAAHVEAAEGRRATMAVSAGEDGEEYPEPTFSVYGAGMLEELRKMVRGERRSLRRLFGKAGVGGWRVPAERAWEMLNVNDGASLAEAERLAPVVAGEEARGKIRASFFEERTMAKKPHVVVMMGDQMRWDCLTAYGKLGVKTPHMDAFAKESVVFDRAYCASPLCVPTRTAIAAGKWPHRTGVIVNGSLSELEKPFSVLRDEHRTYYEQLVNGGYRLEHVGVQHVKADFSQRMPGANFVLETDWVEYLKERGFGLPDDNSARRPSPEFVNGEMAMKRFYPSAYIKRTEYGVEDFMDVYWSRRMCEAIRGADASEPHAWIFHGWAPHPPSWVPEPYFSMYDPAKIEFPENVAEWYDGQPAFLLRTASARSVSFGKDDWRKTWAAYFGLVTMLDECFGRVIAALKDRGVWDDALVIMTMDHGECLGSHALSAKQVMYEESARIPLLIKPPGGGTGRRMQIASHVDLAPTICEYAGVEAPAGCQGRSLKRVIEDAGTAWEDAAFAEFHGDQGRGYPTRAIFTSRYKYIFHFCGPDELYDVAADPMEKKSLAQVAEFQGVKAELKGRLAKWMRETGDFMEMERDANFLPRDWPEVGKRIIEQH